MYKFVLVDFPFIDHPSEYKSRPALMLTSKPYGKHKVVILAYVTTHKEKVEESDLELSKEDESFGETGLIHDSIIKLYKLTSIEARDIKGQLGKLPDKYETQVKRKLKSMFGL